MCDDFFDDFDDFEDDGPINDEPFENDPDPLDDPVESCSDQAGPDWEDIAFFRSALRNPGRGKADSEASGAGGAGKG